MHHPVITAVRFDDHDFRRWVHATFDDGSTERLFGFYADEIWLPEKELLGKTAAQARKLFFRKDRAHLRA